MELEFKDIEYLCAVEEYRSITKAAQALFITQPTLSQYMKHLQERLDVELFHVEGRRIRLTPEGEVLVREGKKLLREREAMMAAMNSVNQTGCGVLRLAVPMGRGSHIIPACIPPFHWRFPKAEIHLTEGHSKELVNQVQSGACDLVIINKPSFPISLEYETLGYENMMLVVGSDTPWADYVRYGEDGQAHISLEQCTDAPFVLHLPWQHTGQIERQLLHKAGIKPNVVLETKNLEASYRLAACGYGLTFLSEYHINRLATEGETCNCLLDDPLTHMEIIIGYRRREDLSFLAREFLEVARQALTRSKPGDQRGLG